MIKTDIKVPLKYSFADIKAAVVERLPITESEMSDLHIVKRTLNLSDKGCAHYDITVAFSSSFEKESGLLKMKKKVRAAEDLSYTPPASHLGCRPVVVGAGPSGLFCALTLAEAGAEPILIERGEDVDSRSEKVARFFAIGMLDEESNVQFGEGGAGAFSDGKLKVGSPDKYKMKVLNEFVASGAPEEILYSTSAHLGTDKLPQLVKAIREKIISYGGEVRFGAKLTDVIIKDGRPCAIEYESHGSPERIDTDTVILAIGHSARDTFRMLYEKGIPMQPKGFGIGVRIEHPREYIDGLIYGEGKQEIGVGASYHLVTHLPSGRSVYSFCMCPGGTVVAAASQRGGIVTNGMSEFARAGDNSNAAFLVSLTPEDFPSDSPLAGIELQTALEQRAYRAAGDSYNAPSQRMEDFMHRTASTHFGTVTPSYPIGTVPTSHDLYLPNYITDSLRPAIEDFDAWLPGFYYPDAPLIGVETRSTSPVRILRDDSFAVLGIEGLYPIGEGAGYAGGIVSSATDGVRCADKILLNNK